MKKILIFLLAALSLTAAFTGGSLAWFTDEVTAKNVIVSGNIQIVQYEQERTTNSSGSHTDTLTRYTQGQQLMPLVQTGPVDFESVEVGGYETRLRDDCSRNYIDKIVTVKNVGVNPAYVRTCIAIPTGGHISTDPTAANWIRWDAVHDAASWSWGKPVTDSEGGVSAPVWPAGGSWYLADDAVIGGVKYDIYVATYAEKLEPGQTTCPSLLGFYLDSSFGWTDAGFYFSADGQRIWLEEMTGVEILVATQAAQTTTFDDPWTALDTVFGQVTAENNPWTGTDCVYVSSQAELQDALDRVSSGYTIRLRDGEYALPDQLPKALRIVGHGTQVRITAPAALTANGVEFCNVTFDGPVAFTGNGEFDLVTFRGDFTAAFNNPAYLTGCVFEAGCSWQVTQDAVRSTVIFEDCTDQNGNPVTG